MNLDRKAGRIARLTKDYVAGLEPMIGEITIRAGKVAAPEKASMRRKRGRMRRLKHEMPRPIDHRAFFLRVAPPEQKHHVLAIVVHQLHDAIGECLPAPALVRSGTPA